MRNWNRKTSSSKLSSVSTSFSTAAKGNFNHNRRTNAKVPQNVDPTKTAFNKILIDKDIRQVYDEVFGESIAEYNANQIAKKHPERQKKDYYSSICHDKKQNHSEKPSFRLVIKTNSFLVGNRTRFFKNSLNDFKKIILNWWSLVHTFITMKQHLICI